MTFTLNALYVSYGSVCLIISEALYLHNNGLEGKIPSEIGLMTRLSESFHYTTFRSQKHLDLTFVRISSQNVYFSMKIA
jgi:hypothetical protein